MHPPADSRLPSPALWALGLVLLTVVLRLPALVHQAPIDDEAVYTVVADTIVDGGRPYVDAIERKPPLLFWLYAAVFDVAGEYNWTALHAVAVVWVLLTMAGLYVVARRLFDWRAGLIAALLYSVFQPWGPWKNLAFNGELLMNLPIVWGWAIALAPGRSRYRVALVPAGMLLCAGFLLKQPAAIAAVPLGVYLLSPAYRTVARAHGCGSRCCTRRCSRSASSARSAASRSSCCGRASSTRRSTGRSPITTCRTSSGCEASRRPRRSSRSACRSSSGRWRIARPGTGGAPSAGRSSAGSRCRRSAPPPARASTRTTTSSCCRRSRCSPRRPSRGCGATARRTAGCPSRASRGRGSR